MKDADGFDDIDAFWDAATTRQPPTTQSVLVPYAAKMTPSTAKAPSSSKRRRTTPFSRDDWSPDLIAADKVPHSARRTQTPRAPQFSSSPTPAAVASPDDDEPPPPPEVYQEEESENDEPPVEVDYDQGEEDNQSTTALTEEVIANSPRLVRPSLVSKKDRSDEEEGVRRSHRVKYPPLKYWKNERLIYHQDSDTKAPRVVAVQLGAPTPHPKRKLPLQAEPVRESRYFCEVKGETAMVWDQTAGETREYPAVARSSSLVESRLPVTSRHRDSEDATGMAAQAFNCGSLDLGKEYGRLPPLISGHVTLPPGAVKDEESVGPCTQIFFVASGQREALELALARDPFVDFDPPLASRFLLSPGDQFHVPPFNVYRLENRSVTTHLHLFWLIVKPLHGEDDDDRVDGASV